MYFSVVIPTYKDSERLNILLENFSNQTLDNRLWEVIIVNNDPEDTINLEKDFLFSTLIINEFKPGSYAARNKGVKEAKGDIVAFTDSDMIPDPNWLETAYKHFSKDQKKEIGILTGPVPLFFKKPNHLTPAEIYEKYTGFDFEGYAREGACGAGNWFSYKSVFEEFGGFREDLKSNGDTELSLKISRNFKVVFVPELINHHPARYTIIDLVLRYRRIVGGTYERKFKGNKIGFLSHILTFIFRRYRFALKKIITVSPKESFAILIVCIAINKGVLLEYFRLIKGNETRR